VDLEGLQPAEPADTVRLLPSFDPWVIGATRHSAALMPDPAHRPRVHRAQGWVSPVLTVGGRIAGTWRHERKGSRIEVSLSPFEPLPAAARDGAEAEAQRLGAFLGGALSLTWA